MSSEAPSQGALQYIYELARSVVSNLPKLLSIVPGQSIQGPPARRSILKAPGGRRPRAYMRFLQRSTVLSRRTSKHVAFSVRPLVRSNTSLRSLSSAMCCIAWKRFARLELTLSLHAGTKFRAIDYTKLAVPDDLESLMLRAGHLVSPSDLRRLLEARLRARARHGPVTVVEYIEELRELREVRDMKHKPLFKNWSRMMGDWEGAQRGLQREDTEVDVVQPQDPRSLQQQDTEPMDDIQSQTPTRRALHYQDTEPMDDVQVQQPPARALRQQTTGVTTLQPGHSAPRCTNPTQALLAKLRIQEAQARTHTQETPRRSPRRTPQAVAQEETTPVHGVKRRAAASAKSSCASSSRPLKRQRTSKPNA